MSYAINWYVNRQVINLKLSGVVTSEDVVQLNRKTVEYTQLGTTPVHIIIDTLDVDEYPTNLRWVMEMMQSNRVSPTGWNIIVHANPGIRLLGSTIMLVLGVPCHTCSTLAAAYAFLNDLQIAPLAKIV